MKLGYARVSTTDQNLSIQRDRLYAAGCEKLFEEKTSGARKKRPALRRLLAELSADDVVVVTRLDRLARSTSELLRIAETIEAKHAGLQSIAEPWADTTTPPRHVASPSGARPNCCRSNAPSFAISLKKENPLAKSPEPSMFMSQQSIAAYTTIRPYDSTPFRSHARSRSCVERPHRNSSVTRTASIRRACASWRTR